MSGPNPRTIPARFTTAAAVAGTFAIPVLAGCTPPRGLVASVGSPPEAPLRTSVRQEIMPFIHGERLEYEGWYGVVLPEVPFSARITVVDERLDGGMSWAFVHVEAIDALRHSRSGMFAYVRVGGDLFSPTHFEALGPPLANGNRLADPVAAARALSLAERSLAIPGKLAPGKAWHIGNSRVVVEAQEDVELASASYPACYRLRYLGNDGLDEVLVWIAPFVGVVKGTVARHLSVLGARVPILVGHFALVLEGEASRSVAIRVPVRNR